MDGLVSFAVVIGTILFYSGRCRIVPDWFRTPDLWLVFDSVEDQIDGELKWSELLCRIEGSERIW